MEFPDFTPVHCPRVADRVCVNDRPALPGYSTWEQASGYFDGDGTIAITFGVYNSQILAKWDDTDREQIEHLRLFLISEGIRPEQVLKRPARGRRKEAYFLTVARGGGLLTLLKRMQPFVDKKKGQVTAVIDYLDDKITCDQLVEALNQSILQKKRRAPARGETFPKLNIPYTRSQGLKTAKDIAREARKFPLKVRLSKTEFEQIRKEATVMGMKFNFIARRHKISWVSVARIVRGYR